MAWPKTTTECVLLCAGMCGSSRLCLDIYIYENKQANKPNMCVNNIENTEQPAHEYNAIMIWPCGGWRERLLLTKYVYISTEKQTGTRAMKATHRTVELLVYVFIADNCENVLHTARKYKRRVIRKSDRNGAEIWLC